MSKITSHLIQHAANLGLSLSYILNDLISHDI